MKFTYILLFVILFFTCDNSKKTVKKDTKEIAKEIMIDAKNCALITVDSSGIAYVRTMDPFLPEDNFTVFMATNPKSSKVNQIKNNNKVTLYYFYAKSVSYVTLQGTAKIINEQNIKEKYWKPEWGNFYKNRTTDYILIKFTPIKANIISQKYNILGDSITWETPQIRF